MRGVGCWRVCKKVVELWDEVVDRWDEVDEGVWDEKSREVVGVRRRVR